MTAKVLIVGGGLMGASIAWHLALRGCRCTVLDKDSPGRHASGVNAGGLRVLNRHPAEIPLSLEASRMWHKMPELVGSDCDAKFCGQVRIAETAEDMASLEQRAELTRSLGYQHEVLLSKRELYELVPELAPICIGAIFCKDDGFARPFHAHAAIKAKAESLGVTFCSNTKVEQIEKRGENWRATSGDIAFEADVLVNCAGAWSGKFAEMLGEPAPIEPGALMLMVTERLPHVVDTVMGAAGRSLSFKQMQNGTLVIGGALQTRLNFAKEQADIDWERLKNSAQTVTHFFPQLNNTRVVRVWSGIEAFMPDRIPVISPSSIHQNVFHAFGFSAHGFQLSPVVGRIVSELILDGHSALPVEPFSIKRF